MTGGCTGGAAADNFCCRSWESAATLGRDERLAESRDRQVRLRLLDLLARYGDAVGQLAAERMEGMPWYVQRNVLSLLGRLPDRSMRHTPAGVMATRYS